MNWYFWVLLVLAMFAFTYLMKQLFNAKIYYFIISMISNEKSAKILDKFKGSLFWKEIAKIGVFLGFGFLGIISWYFKDLKLKKEKTILKIILYSLGILIIGIFLGFFSLSIGNYYLSVIIFFLFGFAGFGILLLSYQAFIIVKGYFLGRSSCPGVAPVIPGVTVPGTNFKIPFFEGWLALIMIMIVHELAHGILARKVGIKVKSLGLLLLGFFPIGAFTEPDEKELRNAKSKDQLMVYAAGPVFNLVFTLVVFIIFILISFAFSPYMANINSNALDGIYITEFSEYTGMCNLGVASNNFNVINPLLNEYKLENQKDFFSNYNLRLNNIGDVNINTTKDVTFALQDSLDKNLESVNFNLTLTDYNKTFSKDYNLLLTINSDNTFGIQSMQREKENFSYPVFYLILIFIITTLHWTYLLSFMVGLFNYIPIRPLDGGAMLPHIINELILYKHPKTRKLIISIITISIIVLFLTVLIINALPLFI